jgi:penicillin amidase
MENKELTDRELEVLENLGQWDYVNSGEEIEPSIFYCWWRGLYSDIWDDEYESTYPLQRPPRDRTLDMIMLEPDAPWFDNIHTEETETLEDLAENSFKNLFERMERRFGEMGDSWKWGYVNNTHLNHLAQIPGLGIRNLFTDGGMESVNAIRGSTGPSWRMIVELDAGEVRGYGVYPGGQSGNPGSRTYDEFVETWRTGDLFSLLFLREKPGNGEEFPLLLRFE